MSLTPREKLKALTYNLWWTWNPEARHLFRNIHPTVWRESGQNPRKLLQRRDHLEKTFKQKEFAHALSYVFRVFQNYIKTPGLYAQTIKKPIAFFSAEYGLHPSLPIYAGGLGILAGDILKEASDLGLPVVGIGLMYSQGYVRQHINAEGWQEDLGRHLCPEDIPAQKVLHQGKWLKIPVYWGDACVYAGVWEVAIGRVKLYLLDTNVEENPDPHREISSTLYVANPELRLKQQMVLGFGGIQLLKTLGIDIAGVHINENFPAFALIARLINFLKEGIPFEQALQKVRETSLFTTHTPLHVAIHSYALDQIKHYFQPLWNFIPVDKDRFLALGAHPDHPTEAFNSAILAMRLSRYINAVSRKHQEVARNQWHFLWSDREMKDVPIDAITNGVHLPTWIDENLQKLFDQYLGNHWQAVHDSLHLWERIDRIPDEELWKIHYNNKKELLSLIRMRLWKRWKEGEVDPSRVFAEGVFLDPDILTIGFARRMTGYKRATLLFHDLERLRRILTNPERPVQIIFAGKAHPKDHGGKEIIKTIFDVARNPDFAGRIAFVEDYDQEIARYMVKGVDVWLNHPLPPLEACGTSGMKAAMNGVLNVSILDGWWLEGYDGQNGWALGDGEVGKDRDAMDAQKIYEILEKEVIPLYYARDDRGIPHAWVKKMKVSIKSVAPRFCARRMLKEYTSKFYTKIDNAAGRDHGT